MNRKWVYKHLYSDHMNNCGNLIEKPWENFRIINGIKLGFPLLNIKQPLGPR